MAARKYKSADGYHLVIREEASGYVIYWEDPKDDLDIGASVGESYKAGAPVLEEETKDEWEVRVAAEAAAPFVDEKPNYGGFIFYKLATARKALAAANKYLLTGEKPWPTWAKTALAAGWKPPKDWKPT